MSSAHVHDTFSLTCTAQYHAVIQSFLSHFCSPFLVLFFPEPVPDKQQNSAKKDLSKAKLGVFQVFDNHLQAADRLIFNRFEQTKLRWTEKGGTFPFHLRTNV